MQTRMMEESRGSSPHHRTHTMTAQHQRTALLAYAKELEDKGQHEAAAELLSLLTEL